MLQNIYIFKCALTAYIDQNMDIQRHNVGYRLHFRARITVHVLMRTCILLDKDNFLELVAMQRVGQKSTA